MVKNVYPTLVVLVAVSDYLIIFFFSYLLLIIKHLVSVNE